ncbi:MAG: hypothetical protein EPN75_01090 [Beijerinckiaceae bacterium]|nr:MAG: hypothetical protein EPN75_01090 [Beijerinckiaceae bacterium]
MRSEIPLTDDAAAVIGIDRAMAEPALMDEVQIGLVIRPTPFAGHEPRCGGSCVWREAVMDDEHPALVDQIECGTKITVRQFIFMEAIDEDDIKTKLVSAHRRKAFGYIEVFASKIDFEAIVEIGRTIVHKAMCFRQPFQVQILVKIAGRRGTKFQVSRKPKSCG